jgi:hypothetical protein
MDEDEFLPVELSCPDSHGGSLVIVTENVTKKRDRIVITYDGDKVTAVRAGTASEGEEFDDYIVIKDVPTEEDADAKEFAAVVVSRNDSYRTRICLGEPETRDRFSQELVDNREKLRRARN